MNVALYGRHVEFYADTGCVTHPVQVHSVASESTQRCKEGIAEKRNIENGIGIGCTYFEAFVH
jgi:hypothetical protein